MLIALFIFSILFVSWLIYIALSEKGSSTTPVQDKKDSAKDVHDKLNTINTILEIRENPEKAE